MDRSSKGSIESNTYNRKGRSGADKRGRMIFLSAMAALLILQLAVMLFYGNKKAGFHEDELYTYYSTNKTAGLFVEDRQWRSREEIRNDFVVLPGERFRYNVVKQMQSWDVHPPFYYYIFHTACSLFPGVFDKWLGIGVNLAAYVISYLLLAYGAYIAVMGESRSHGLQDVGAKILTFLTCLGWGFGAAVISGVMFIRMYQWLTVFILLCMVLHLRVLKNDDLRVRSFFLPLGLTVFFGFLTQYYYIIFHFFLGFGFCLLLLKRKKIKELLGYIAACGAGLLGAVLYYPSSLSHIFRGYRGVEAVDEFSDMSNTVERLRFFYGLFDDYMMNGALSWWALAICLLAVTASYRKKRSGVRSRFFTPPIALMLFACAGYFFTVSKTALLLGETSNRYQLPIYGILLFLILYSVWELSVEGMFTGRSPISRSLVGQSPVDTTSMGRIPVEQIGALVLALALVLMDGMALKDGRVFFLYEEEKKVMEFVRSHEDAAVIVFYNDASPDNVWRLSDELMEYERVFLASQGNQAPISDEVIIGSGSLLAYVADHEDKEGCLERLLEAAPLLSEYHVVAEKGLWTLYELKG